MLLQLHVAGVANRGLFSFLVAALNWRHYEQFPRSPAEGQDYRPLQPKGTFRDTAITNLAAFMRLD